MTLSQRALCVLTVLAGAVFPGIAAAAWTSVDPGSGPDDPARYIDPDTVRQAGPMAIYRQVAELTVYAGRRESGLQSILRLAEYDCMSARVRVLQETGFALPDARGETLPLPPAVRRRGDWAALGTHPAGETVWKLVCPGSGSR